MYNNYNIPYDDTVNLAVSNSDLKQGYSYEDSKMMGQESFRSLVLNSYEFIDKYIRLLPVLDATIARLYYLDGLSQDQISKLLEISQAAVSRRLKYITDRIKFFIKKPTLSPVQVREDFEKIFPESLFETAYIFYWELAQNRVKYLINTSQSGAANKFKRILETLEEYKAHFSEKRLNESNDNDMIDLSNQKDIELEGLVLIYLDYFRFIEDKSSIISHLCKKNDDKRTVSIEVGECINS